MTAYAHVFKDSEASRKAWASRRGNASAMAAANYKDLKFQSGMTKDLHPVAHTTEKMYKLQTAMTQAKHTLAKSLKKFGPDHTETRYATKVFNTARDKFETAKVQRENAKSSAKKQDPAYLGSVSAALGLA